MIWYNSMIVHAAIKGPHGTAGGRLRTKVEIIMSIFMTVPAILSAICFFAYDDDIERGQVGYSSLLHAVDTIHLVNDVLFLLR
jgi:hypothetical protein